MLARDLSTQRNKHDALCYAMQTQENEGRVKGNTTMESPDEKPLPPPGEVAQLSPQTKMHARDTRKSIKRVRNRARVRWRAI